MRILFVDDEPRVLSGLRRVLEEVDDDWEISYASGGPEALSVLARAPQDVVVSDMRMPGMDGAELLHKVQSVCPKAVRIILTGQADEASSIKALRVAHQFLNKPFDAEQLIRIISRTHEVQLLLADERLREALGEIDRLPPAPEVSHKLNELFAAPEVDLREVTATIQRDPGVCAKLLQLTNSAFFARRVSVDDVDSAVSYLGANVIRSLVMGIELFNLGDKASKRIRTLTERLRHDAMKVAKDCAVLAMRTPMQRSALTAGLLLESGQLAWGLVREEWLDVEEKARRNKQPLEVAELAAFGVTHAEVGAFLLGIWGIPYPVIEAVALHHQTRIICGENLSMAVVGAVAVAVRDHVALADADLASLRLLEAYRDITKKQQPPPQSRNGVA